MNASTTAQATAAVSAASIAAASRHTPSPASDEAVTMRATMRASVGRHYSRPDAIALAVEDIARPEPGADEVLIEVHAAGVDRGQWHLVTGRPFIMRLMGFGLRRPAQPVPGGDVAGVVVAVGADVTRVRAGDEVFGTATGAYAELAVAKEDALLPLPSTLSFAQAATLVTAGVTAQHAVEDIAKVTSGQHVLVLGASGGVGSYAVQLAVAAGARVTAVGSGAKADHMRALGAGRIVDYRATDVTAEDTRYDAIVDIGGRRPLRRLSRILAPEGTLVIVGGEGGDALTGGIGRQLGATALNAFTRQTLAMFFSTPTPETIARLRDRIVAGEVRPPLTRTYALEQAAAAIEDIAAGRITGKAAIVVRGENPGATAR